MEKTKTFAVFTVITFLLFAVTTAFNPTFIPTIDKQSVDQVNDPADSSEKTQTFTINNPIDSTPRIRLTRSNQFNRHAIDGTPRIPLRFVRRHPCRKFRMSNRNDMISSDQTVTFDPKTLGHQVPVEWLEFKHKYGHGRVHGHHHHHDHDDDDDDMKYEVDGEKFERHHHKHKGGFMRSVRKFLKHTFDD